MAIRLSASRLDLGNARLDNADLRGYAETTNALGNVTGATTIDLTLGTVITATTTGATTWTVTNVPSATQYCSFTLVLTNGGRFAQTWMSGTKWQNSIAPTLAALGTDVLTFFTVDNGTTWRGSLAMPAISSGGQMFLWGQNSYGGPLGLGDVINRSSPVQVSGTWAMVSGEHYAHTVALKPDGSLWVWGVGSEGRLGLGDIADRSSPVQVAGTWTWGIATYKGTAALRTDGTMWIWGRGNNGLLGLGDVADRSSPVQLAGNWSKIVAGFYQVFGLRSDSTLWSWGGQESPTSFGQLGQGDTVKRSSPTQIGTGTWSDVTSFGYHGAAVKEDGAIFLWGRNTSGQLGFGDTIHRSSPTQLTGTWSAFGGSTFSQETHVIKADGSLFGWGKNDSGNVGDDTAVNRSSPVQIAGTWSATSGGQSCHIGLKTNGGLFTWGGGAHGRGGLGDTIYRSSPTQISGTWSQIIANGGRHQGAIRA